MSRQSWREAWTFVFWERDGRGGRDTASSFLPLARRKARESMSRKPSLGFDSWQGYVYLFRRAVGKARCFESGGVITSQHSTSFILSMILPSHQRLQRSSCSYASRVPSTLHHHRHHTSTATLLTDMSLTITLQHQSAAFPPAAPLRILG